MRWRSHMERTLACAAIDTIACIWADENRDLRKSTPPRVENYAATSGARGAQSFRRAASYAALRAASVRRSRRNRTSERLKKNFRAAPGAGSAGAELRSEQLLRDGRVRLTARLLHDRSGQETHHVGLTRLVVGHDLRVRGE